MTIIRNSSGQVIRKSRNLRGLVDHARRVVPEIATLSDTDGRFLLSHEVGQQVRRYELIVEFHNGDVATSYWADWRVCADWLATRRTWRGITVRGPREFLERYQPAPSPKYRQHFESYSELEAAMKPADGFRFLPKFGPASFRCHDCRQVVPLNMSGIGGTGYGTDREGAMFCYPCGAKRQVRDLKRDGEGQLYLVQRESRYFVTDWTGKLSRPVTSMSVGRHNIARKRYDVRFYIDDEEWSGTTYGDNTQICHVRRLKK